MPRMGFQEFRFPEVYAGITTMECSACTFQFVYVEPEETQTAYATMSQHFHDAHPKLKPYDVPVTCTRH